MENYNITYNTIRNIYEQINKAKIPVYMIGGISAAIQTGTDLYRKNSDLDLMVDKQNTPQLLDILTRLGYQIEDKRGVLTDNYIDKAGDFHVCCHDINAKIHSSEMLGIGIFVYDINDGNILRSTYCYDQRSLTYVETQSVIPKELFDLTYDKEIKNYRGMNLRCQTKEATYLSKSKGNRDKDILDASVLKEYIGTEEEARIKRIKKLEKKIEQYKIVYDKDGNILSSEKLPSWEDKIEQFISEITIQNPGKNEEEIKNIVLNNQLVKKYMEQDDDIRNIMGLWQKEQSKGDVAKHAAKIAHTYIYTDELSKEKSWELSEDKKLEIQNRTAEIANNHILKQQTIHNKEKREIEQK